MADQAAAAAGDRSNVTSRPAPSTIAVPLHTSLFEAAVEQHLDESKPVPLARRQAESLLVQWENHPIIDNNDEKDTTAVPLPSHGLSGTLILSGEHVVVNIDAKCTWQEENGGKGSLHFQLSASARFRTKSELRRQAAREGNDKKQQRIASKIRAGMIQRLKTDPYVKKLLEQQESEQEEAKANNRCKGMFVCEAVVHLSRDGMEERVNVSEDAVEGIRRAILSQSDGTLAMMEFLLAMPYLPRCRSNANNNNDDNIPTCPLADRAQLRLLEDAMVDACEKEGEDELIDDLTISEKHSDDDDDCEANEEERQEGRGKNTKSTTTASKRRKGLS